MYGSGAVIGLGNTRWSPNSIRKARPWAYPAFGGEDPGLGLGAIAGLPIATMVHLDIKVGISVSD